MNLVIQGLANLDVTIDVTLMLFRGLLTLMAHFFGIIAIIIRWLAFMVTKFHM